VAAGAVPAVEPVFFVTFGGAGAGFTACFGTPSSAPVGAGFSAAAGSFTFGALVVAGAVVVVDVPLVVAGFGLRTRGVGFGVATGAGVSAEGGAAFGLRRPNSRSQNDRGRSSSTSGVASPAPSRFPTNATRFDLWPEVVVVAVGSGAGAVAGFLAVVVAVEEIFRGAGAAAAFFTAGFGSLGSAAGAAISGEVAASWAEAAAEANPRRAITSGSGRSIGWNTDENLLCKAKFLEGKRRNRSAAARKARTEED